MKKLFITLLAAGATLAASAVDSYKEFFKLELSDGTVTTVNVKDIAKMSFEKQNLFKSFNGYLLVSSTYFKDTYYGNDAVVSIYNNDNGEYFIEFSDPTWGDARFEKVSMSGGTLSGEGTIAMAKHGSTEKTSYTATISGAMTSPVITATLGAMGEVSINFNVGTAPDKYTVPGTYSGTMTCSVGGLYNYDADATSVIVEFNSDETINVTIKEHSYDNTVIGTLTLGELVIPNIPKDSKTGAYTLAYSSITEHFKCVSSTGITTIDKDYNASGTLTVTKTDTGIKVENADYKLGAMPYALSQSYTGTK